MDRFFWRHRSHVGEPVSFVKHTNMAAMPFVIPISEGHDAGLVEFMNLFTAYPQEVVVAHHSPHTTPQGGFLWSPPSATHHLHYPCHQTDTLSLVQVYQQLSPHT